MEIRNKKKLITISICGALLLYFFLAARPLSKELSLTPLSSQIMGTNQRASDTLPSQGLHHFKIGKRYGYFSDDGKILMSQLTPYAVSLSDSRYIEYTHQATSLSLHSVSTNDELKIPGEGYPFFVGERLFMVAPGQTAVKELDSQGNPLWNYDFNSVITAFVAGQELAVFGLMDGTVVALNQQGKEVLNFTPAGSRVNIIYGLALSTDAQYIAIISGLDKQRLLILKKDKQSYTLLEHEFLSSDFRRPVMMSFVPNTGALLYETEGGIAMRNLLNNEKRLSPIIGGKDLGNYNAQHGIFFATTVLGQKHNILAFDRNGNILFNLKFLSKDHIFLAQDENIFTNSEQEDGQSVLLRLGFEEK